MAEGVKKHFHMLLKEHVAQKPSYRARRLMNDNIGLRSGKEIKIGSIDDIDNMFQTFGSDSDSFASTSNAPATSSRIDASSQEDRLLSPPIPRKSLNKSRDVEHLSAIKTRPTKNGHDASISTIVQSSFAKSFMDQATQYKTPESSDPEPVTAHSRAEVTYREMATQMESGGPSKNSKLREVDTNTDTSLHAKKSPATVKRKSMNSTFVKQTNRPAKEGDGNTSSASSAIAENIESQFILQNIKSLFKSKENQNGRLEKFRESANPSDTDKRKHGTPIQATSILKKYQFNGKISGQTKVKSAGTTTGSLTKEVSKPLHHKSINNLKKRLSFNAAATEKSSSAPSSSSVLYGTPIHPAFEIDGQSVGPSDVIVEEEHQLDSEWLFASPDNRSVSIKRKSSLTKTNDRKPSRSFNKGSVRKAGDLSQRKEADGNRTNYGDGHVSSATKRSHPKRELDFNSNNRKVSKSNEKRKSSRKSEARKRLAYSSQNEDSQRDASIQRGKRFETKNDATVNLVDYSSSDEEYCPNYEKSPKKSTSKVHQPRSRKKNERRSSRSHRSFFKTLCEDDIEEYVENITFGRQPPAVYDAVESSYDEDIALSTKRLLELKNSMVKQSDDEDNNSETLKNQSVDRNTQRTSGKVGKENIPLKSDSYRDSGKLQQLSSKSSRQRRVTSMQNMSPNDEDTDVNVSVSQIRKSSSRRIQSPIKVTPNKNKSASQRRLTTKDQKQVTHLYSSSSSDENEQQTVIENSPLIATDPSLLLKQGDFNSDALAENQTPPVSDNAPGNVSEGLGPDGGGNTLQKWLDSGHSQQRTPKNKEVDYTNKLRSQLIKRRSKYTGSSESRRQNPERSLLSPVGGTMSGNKTRSGHSGPKIGRDSSTPRRAKRQRISNLPDASDDDAVNELNDEPLDDLDLVTEDSRNGHSGDSYTVTAKIKSDPHKSLSLSRVKNRFKDASGNKSNVLSSSRKRTKPNRSSSNQLPAKDLGLVTTDKRVSSSKNNTNDVPEASRANISAKVNENHSQNDETADESGNVKQRKSKRTTRANATAKKNSKQKGKKRDNNITQNTTSAEDFHESANKVNRRGNKNGNARKHKKLLHDEFVVPNHLFSEHPVQLVIPTAQASNSEAEGSKVRRSRRIKATRFAYGDGFVYSKTRDANGFRKIVGIRRRNGEINPIDNAKGGGSVLSFPAVEEPKQKKRNGRRKQTTKRNFYGESKKRDNKRNTSKPDVSTAEEENNEHQEDENNTLLHTTSQLSADVGSLANKTVSLLDIGTNSQVTVDLSTILCSDTGLFGSAPKVYQYDDGVAITRGINLTSMTGFSQGRIVIKPGKRKQEKVAGSGTMCFAVYRGTIELTVGGETIPVPEGCYFQVPQKNRYAMCNPDKKKDAVLFFSLQIHSHDNAES